MIWWNPHLIEIYHVNHKIETLADSLGYQLGVSYSKLWSSHAMTSLRFSWMLGVKLHFYKQGTLPWIPYFVKFFHEVEWDFKDLTKSHKEFRGSYHINLMVFILSKCDYLIGLRMCPHVITKYGSLNFSYRIIIISSSYQPVISSYFQ